MGRCRGPRANPAQAAAPKVAVDGTAHRVGCGPARGRPSVEALRTVAHAMNRRGFLAVAAGAILGGVAKADDAMEAMRFSALRPGSALPGWLQPYEFPNQPRHTQFTLVEDEGRTVLRARADAATSGLIRSLRVDARVYPVLSWRWKVMNLPAKG